MNNSDFVYIDEFDIPGTNYYWERREMYGLSKKDLVGAEMDSSRLIVHKSLIEPLFKVQAGLKKKQLGLLIKEGYRPKKLYELVYKKRVALHGKDITEKLLNMNDMPHASGKSVDITLRDLETNEELPMRDKEDDPDALFFDFYIDKKDSNSVIYQERQDILRKMMIENGFEIGKKKEYFHYNYVG